MENGSFKFKDKAEFEAMTLEDKTRYFQELMQELKKKEEELERVNLEIAERRPRQVTKSPASKES